ncbi:MAG: E3 binding domain-containing protein [Pseudomonadales bacterium]|jgi:pyruvate/2-oxoglutarate dehydrogenase complex dihydrolipoamide acyltransferase (E2) component|nr:E3 binding domain-containing protein [Pseudomonadales bacterium]
MHAFNVTIKTIGRTSATAGIFLYCPKHLHRVTRKLEVGEVVRVFEGAPGYEEVMAQLDRDDCPLEITTKPATRPLIFEDAQTCQYSSPAKDRLVMKASERQRIADALERCEEQMRAEHLKFGAAAGAEPGEIPVQEEQPPEATPGAISLAESHDVDLRDVVGSGVGGKVKVADVRAFVEARDESDKAA